MGISNYSKYIEVFKYFLTNIVYVRFCVCPNSNKICYLIQIVLRLSTVDPIMASLYRKREMYRRIHITNHGGGGVASVES